MLISLNWLKEYVNIDCKADDLGEALTMSGTKVETMIDVSPKIENILTGRIEKIDRHPNADKLVVCQVNFGDFEKVIVTAAKNVFEGAVIPVALDGAVLANGETINDSDFRGVLSQGMFCSIEELGMNQELFSKDMMDGIYILPAETKLGESVKTLLWLDDVIIDVELTANRPDCQSVLGIARETSATLNQPLNSFETYNDRETSNAISDYLSIQVENDLCKRYIGKMMRVKKIEPSPLWIQVKLLNSGVRPINNIVDVTNYVMLELGQPLHAFDYKSLGSDRIVVKTTNDSKIVTLDNQERSIDQSMLMITNGEIPVAIAGVMGGQNSEINQSTELVVLESACFDKSSVRLTSKKLGLRTEASARYEKGVDSDLALTAALRATHLLKEIDAVEVIEGMIDIYPNPQTQPEIEMDPQWVNRFIGIDLPAKTMIAYLKRLFFEVRENDELIFATPPYFRSDILIKEDLAEEIARIYGYDNIPGTIMGGETQVGEKSEVQKTENLIKRVLVGQGYYETMTSSFTSENKISGLNEGLPSDMVKLINPLGEENSLMRRSLIGHQLDVIALNSHRKNQQGRFFELANTYSKAIKSNTLPRQEKKIVLSSYGNTDFFDLKGTIELMLNELGITNVLFSAGGSDTFHPGRKAEIFQGEIKLGEIGEIHPLVVKNFNLPKRCYVSEISFESLMKVKQNNIRFKELPKFPGTSRDLAIVVEKSIPASSVLAIIKNNSGDLLESVELFDVYTGEQVPNQHKSLAYALSFRHLEKTLSDEDINPVIEKILSELEGQLNGRLRD
ncbi:phenylalanine--tRNA ligase subunit beta [Eubacteriaceae bacterium ES2]|nr:phenylalanine--tRNA ligase subunit beta [Eubacteriaceae bacterium ES2]